MTVSVTASDGTNNISKSTTVVFTNPVTGGGGNIPSTCGDGTKTVKASQISAFDGLPIVVDPFGKSQTAVYTINVPAATAGAKFVLSWSSFGGTSDQIARKMWISQTPCDLTNGMVANGQAFSGSINGVLNDGTSGVTGKVGSSLVHLQTGDTWYIMIQNLNSNGKNTCTIADCPLVIKPQSAS